ncbi:MAG TPA: serine--tRNA ligase [Acholeplasmatales bacterium]|nr:MAG: serine--tRNA ligase [Tenericutes bacterium GWF2_57_13]HAQ56909.1 serine--tRNA ligase [Acholeplasmatales bacterium]
MLDLNRIRENPEKVKELLARKGWEADFTELNIDFTRRSELLVQIETVKAEQNRLSASVPAVKKQNGDIQAIFAKVRELAAKNAAAEAELKDLQAKIDRYVEALPNTPDEDLLSGGKENNQPIRTNLTKPVFAFPVKNHVELCEAIGLIDYARAAKISGSGTWIYTNLGAQLEWALLNFFISEHLADHYEFILPPHLLNEDSGYTAGQFPKFRNDVFWLKGADPEKFMLPTAETALVNLHRDEILLEDDLPKKYFAYTPCYRQEAGSYRTEERGMVRGYQFNKVEMVQYTTEEGSDAAFDEMVEKAERIVRKLGLHFQTSKLAAGDCSHAMARTFDIEVWIPSMGIFKEVSSASNARDYQARRGKIRYRDKATGKTKFCHTLNASGLATSRIFPAIIEQYQQADGSVKVPDVLVPFMGGVTVLRPKTKK